MKSSIRLCGLIALFAVAGCATSVPIQVQRLPAMNTQGIQKLAIMPFTTTDSSSLQRQAAALLSSESFARIQALEYFTIIDANQRNFQSLADAIFNGKVVAVTVKDTSTPGSRKTTDKDGKETVINYVDYYREVAIAYSYSITRTKDGSLIGPLNKSDKKSVSVRDNQSNLASAESLMQDLVRSKIKEIDRDIAPYTETQYRILMDEKNKAIKQQVKDANAQVKAKNYAVAKDAYLKIYQDTSSYAAAYNASILIEASGDLEGALSFMQGVYSKTGNPKAQVEVARLQKALKDVATLKTFKMNNQQDKVVSNMVEALPSKLPKNARVAVINNSQKEKDLADAVVDGLVSGLIGKNITVIDRNNRAIMDMERNYQLSGNVDDKQMVNIGNEAGVNVMILVSVTVSGNLKRLSVRVSDLERGSILYQSPQSDEMNL